MGRVRPHLPADGNHGAETCWVRSGGGTRGEAEPIREQRGECPQRLDKGAGLPGGPARQVLLGLGLPGGRAVGRKGNGIPGSDLVRNRSPNPGRGSGPRSRTLAELGLQRWVRRAQDLDPQNSPRPVPPGRAVDGHPAHRLDSGSTSSARAVADWWATWAWRCAVHVRTGKPGLALALARPAAVGRRPTRGSGPVAGPRSARASERELGLGLGLGLSARRRAVARTLVHIGSRLGAQGLCGRCGGACVRQRSRGHGVGRGGAGRHKGPSQAGWNADQQAASSAQGPPAPAHDCRDHCPWGKARRWMVQRVEELGQGASTGG